MIGRTNAGFGGGEQYRVTKVYGGENPPTNPKTYDIFLRTTVALGGGEIAATVVRIPTWDALDGTWYVNLRIGAFSDGTATYFAQGKRNGQSISGFPGQAYIRSGGQWKRCDGYIWYTGAWLQFSSVWDGELLDGGNQYASVTGGWKTYYGAISTSDSYLYATGTSGVRLGTTNTIDMTSYSQLHVIGGGYGEYIESGGAHNITHFVGVSDNPSAGSFLASSRLAITYGVGNVAETVIDISNITGSHYVSTTAWKGGVAAGVYLTKVWMT